jgi:hypothetical protein
MEIEVIYAIIFREDTIGKLKTHRNQIEESQATLDYLQKNKCD